MGLQDILKSLGSLFGGAAPRLPAIPQPVAGPAMPAQPVLPDPGDVQVQQVQDRLLTDHFRLFEATSTSNTALQGKNHCLSANQIATLTETCKLAEIIRTELGCAVDCHSAYRCPELNGATPGAAKKSQHMLCQAMDLSPAGPDTESSIQAAFDKILAAAKAKKFKFGQLIIEQANRSYGKALWIHVSLGPGYREPSRCGEVMKMVAAADGTPEYTMLEKVPQEA